jgi:hypothetical protein
MKADELEERLKDIDTKLLLQEVKNRQTRAANAESHRRTKRAEENQKLVHTYLELVPEHTKTDDSRTRCSDFDPDIVVIPGATPRCTRCFLLLASSDRIWPDSGIDFELKLITLPIIEYPKIAPSYPRPT